MAIVSPKTKIQELSEQVSLFGDTQKQIGRFDEVSWIRLLNEIKKLESNSNFAATSVLLQSTMQGIKGDIKKAGSLLESYSRSWGKDVAWYLTRAGMAQMFGDIKFVTEMLELSYPHGNINHLSVVVDACANAGCYISAYDALLDVEKINHSHAATLVARYPFLLPSVRYLQNNSVDQSGISERILAATNFVHGSGYMLNKYRVLCSDAGIVYEIIIDEDITKLADLNISIYDIFASKLDFSFSEHVSVGVTPKE